VSRSLFLLCLAVLPACGGSTGESRAPQPAAPTPVPSADGLRSSSALSSSCYDWPATSWTPSHFALTLTRLGIEPAIDFTLRDVGGTAHSLRSLLQTRPVLLVQGSLTCPLYRGNVAPLNELAQKPYDAVSTFGDRVHFLHVYVIEPHPQGPDPSPYTGDVSEKSFSTIRQAQSYAQRVADARTARALLAGRQLQVVDDFTNPAWCSYGTCPNCAFLIRQDGMIDTVQLVLSVPTMERAIRALVG
jgi:hypothetical protein